MDFFGGFLSFLISWASIFGFSQAGYGPVNAGYGPVNAGYGPIG